jgi:hypothetical protein
MEKITSTQPAHFDLDLDELLHPARAFEHPRDVVAWRAGNDFEGAGPARLSRPDTRKLTQCLGGRQWYWRPYRRFSHGRDPPDFNQAISQGAVAQLFRAVSPWSPPPAA